MTDFLECILMLGRHNANFSVYNKDSYKIILCYDPYLNECGEVVGYVYHWKDIYNEEGNLIEHKVYY